MKTPGNPHNAVALPWILAAPSCVLPAGIAENCAFLALRFDEIGLAFFETESCLGYTEADLPGELGLLPVSWHMHLPLDLPWAEGPGRVAQVVLALRDKAGALAPTRFVLHPPATPRELAQLAGLLEQGGLAPARVMLENIQGRDLALHWEVVGAAGFGVCLDLGHMLVHGQEDFLDLPGFWERAGVAHLHAPGADGTDRHDSLARLDGQGRALLRRVLEHLSPGATAVIEIFRKDPLLESIDVLRAACAAMEEPA